MNKYKIFSKAEELKRQRIEEKTCLNKRKYETPEKAKENGAELFYKCPFCNFFHASAKIFKKYPKIKK